MLTAIIIFRQATWGRWVKRWFTVTYSKSNFMSQ